MNLQSAKNQESLRRCGSGSLGSVRECRLKIKSFKLFSESCLEIRRNERWIRNCRHELGGPAGSRRTLRANVVATILKVWRHIRKSDSDNRWVFSRRTIRPSFFRLEMKQP